MAKGRQPANPVTGLTAKEEVFCFESIHLGNPHRAYRIAYDAAGMTQASVRAEVHKLLQKPAVADRMHELQAVADQKLGVTIERIAKELACIGFSRMSDLYYDDGRLIPVHLLPDDVARAVHSVTITERQGGMLLNVKTGAKVDKAEAKKLRAAAKEGDAPPVEYVAMRDKKITLHDKQPALQTLARWKKMITEKGDETADPNDVRGLTDEQLEAEIRANKAALDLIDRARARRTTKKKAPQK